MDIKVFLKKISSYTDPALSSTLFKMLEQSVGNEAAGKKVLIKPNILGASDPSEAVTTHPAVVGAVIQYFKKLKCEIRVGDSPAVDSYARAYQKTGLTEVCATHNVELVTFKKMKSYYSDQAQVVKRFQMSEHLDWAEYVVTLPKLKNHIQMYYTGALKNMFGLINGLDKSKYHFRFIDRKTFAAMIVDLNILAKPHCAVIDAIESMQGAGPRNGTPVNTGFLGVSKDALALDCACATLVGYNPTKIPILQDALSRKDFYIDAIEEIEYNGDFTSASRIDSFQRVNYVKDVAFLRNALPPFVYQCIRNLFIPRPVFNHKKCVVCKKCIEICSAEALSVRNQKIEIDRNACILCFCCHEACPYDAILLKK